MKITQNILKIKEYYYFPKYSKWIFIGLLLAFSFIYNYQDILFKSPQSVHLWRQCDCLSITKNYYEHNNSFFAPAIHNLGEDGTGKTISEFPMFYFFIAQLWKVFGYNEFIYRFVVMLIFFASLFMLFKLFENTLEDSILAIITTLFLFTSPTLIYYANNFLMDIPAFSFAIIGLFFFIKFQQTSGNKYLYLFAIFYAVAGLLKISSLLSFVAISCLFFLEIINIKLDDDNKIFKHRLKHLLVFLFVIIVQVIWYMYAQYYNNKYNSGLFLMGILPIWKMQLSEIKITIDAIDYHMTWDYFRKETQYVFILIFIFVMASYKKMNKLMFWLLFFTSLGFLSFILLFFLALKDHDYYTINLFVIVPILLIAFLLLLKEKYNKIFSSLIFRIIVIGFLIHNVDFARRRIEGRFNPGGWQNKYYLENVKTFKEIPPYLRSIGITKDDRVLSLSDHSVNISLYLMNQKGWTGFDVMADSSSIRNKMKLGAKYLFISDSNTYLEQGIRPFLRKKVGIYKNIDIYAL
jgi:hypothetical protein